MQNDFGAEYLDGVETPRFGGAKWIQQCYTAQNGLIVCDWTRVGSYEIA